MGAVVGFDYASWLALFPEFAYVNQAQALLYFDLATIAHRNDIDGFVADAVTQSRLLNIVTAHIAALFATKNGSEPANPLVGRITNASEGSVSVGTDYGPVSASEAWWVQTRYGAMYWMMVAPYRSATYIPGPQRVFDSGGFQYFPARGRWF